MPDEQMTEDDVLKWLPETIPGAFTVRRAYAKNVLTKMERMFCRALAAERKARPMPHTEGPDAIVEILRGTVALPDYVAGSFVTHAQALKAVIEEIVRDPNHDNGLLSVLCDSARVLWEAGQRPRLFQLEEELAAERKARAIERAADEKLLREARANLIAARHETTTQEERNRQGNPGFSCGFIDDLDAAVARLDARLAEADAEKGNDHD